MLEILQAQNKEKIVLVRLGAFYIATGRDAILLHTRLNLKVTCFKNNICKVGIPVNSLDKYLEKIDKTKYRIYGKLSINSETIHHKHLPTYI